MKKVRLSDLSEPVRSFLTGIQQGEAIVVEDENGQLQCGITPYAEATPAEKRHAQALLEQLWQKTDRAMRDAGVTEKAVDRDLQEGD